MLTEQQFRDEIRGFVDKMNENNFHWQLKEIGKYARETHLKTLSDGRVITSETHILYNSTYQVPTIWFNFFENNGSPLPFRTVIRDVLNISETEESEASIRSRISHYEHPFMGVLYYNIHPCNTSNIMKELNTDRSYLMSWFSVYGQQIGLKLPDRVL
ncbi:Ubiquitin-like-conjugating enzyme ATG10 [Caenorhabditis elegans]|uniref:Ubiquitin-like-conjugating enzyme ATG10 n=1 Tax=Caenorhabditis elegans TaxID=6239 RepID=Q18991_CAEEL|nr:Autophagy_act_C domain-containing protein [Caenorhabditis elegans]CAA91060.2 Autophagy_act_C domain-containing protein [Caenorhabditis elegans]|eukprot:NP_495839.2 AuTophaGy (yeast Atg homolog) [Caenorhabditis elegans]